MSTKKILGLTALGLAGLLVIGGIVGIILVHARPNWYEPEQLSREELLEAEEQMIRTTAKFKSAAQIAEPFILELSGKQINDRLAVLVNRYRILPEYIADPVVFLGDGAIWAGARVTWKGQQAIVSVRLRILVDSAGLLRMELDKLKAGALSLPETFLPDTMAAIEKSLLDRLAPQRNNPAKAKDAASNEQIIRAVFSALSGESVVTRFVTRDDLHIVIEDIRIKPDLLEIQFRPISTGDQTATEKNN
ncbi:MAG: hypothetical protein GWP14_00445 [Actinobacteria bacterium]|nr:hypothetical protein [Actinomycetota bacterium]